ncbi:hypothetical protein CC86DRAFT_411943 [Ophiobolus disseminans]|uniref:Azaphilone pigments biosynthesis cluster protein L N-terminal domain-containing protein n=1 Tax=Ophiobolus disseminans TaxID=1469910 RepID=A0A6A6ZHU1_9PLEO|nr:hypothetical protein CC86DRAFT_411943 [Ophiobolus disseminans]
MEPLAIVAACATLISAVGRCAHTIVIFGREVRDARGDLEMIDLELKALRTVLVSLKDDIAKPSSNTLPHTLASHLGFILKSCEGVVEAIVKSLEKHSSSRIGRGGHWTIGGGKDDMTKFRSSLEAHKSSLNLALVMVTMTVTRDIKKDTSETHRYAAGIPDVKDDTTKILDEIRRLRARLPADLQQGPNVILQRFLDESTSYAETVVNEEHMGDMSDQPPPVPRAAAKEEYHYPATYTDFAFYPPEREVTSRQNSPHYSPHHSPRHSPNPFMTPRRDLTPVADHIPSPRSYISHSHIVEHSDASSEFSRLSLSAEKDVEKSRISSASSRGIAPPSRPVSRAVSNRTQHRETANHASLKPTPPIEFQNHLRRPDDWKFLTLNHRTESGNQSLSAPELWTHRYTAMTRSPKHLAEGNFKLRQQLEPPRETMLLIGVYYPESLGDDEFNARFATTVESVSEALAATHEACGTSHDTPWWTTVVVLLINNDAGTQQQYAFTRHGMRLRCDAESEHCGIAPDKVRDDERKIFAHLWEHTTLRTKISWNRRGVPEYFDEGVTPLQLIQCQYTSRAKSRTDIGSAEHLLPFIRMLDARTCLSIAAGDKIGKFDVFDAYMTSRHTLSSIKIADPMQLYPGTAFESSFTDYYGRVPTKIYPLEGAVKFKQEKRSLYTRVGALFR